MDLTKFMAAFAKEINGKFSQYDQEKTVIVVPIKGGRFQTVVGMVKKLEKYNRNGIEMSTSVCRLTHEIDLEDILRQNSTLCYARFAIDGETLKVEATALMDQITEAVMKEIILEIATVADRWENKLTGMDVH